MSCIAQLKGHIITHLPKTGPIRSAILDCLNALDADMDEAGYDPSELTEQAFINLDAAYIEKEVEDMKDEEEKEVAIVPEDEDDDNIPTSYIPVEEEDDEDADEDDDDDDDEDV